MNSTMSVGGPPQADGDGSVVSNTLTSGGEERIGDPKYDSAISEKLPNVLKQGTLASILSQGLIEE